MTWIFSNALMKDFVSSHSSPAPGAGSSAGTSSAGEQFAQSNGSPTRQAYLCSGRTTASSLPSLSGMTSKLLTVDLGEAVLTWYLEGFLARTSAAPERARASPARVRDYGVRWRGLSTRFDHDSHLWRTRPSLWDEGLTSSLGTLPRWGSMHGGVLWERVMRAPHTNEIESGLSLPTPVKYDSHGTWESNNYHGLGWQAKHGDQGFRPAGEYEKGYAPSKTMYPTPMTSGMESGGGSSSVLKYPLKEALIQDAARREQKIYPTPIRSDATVGKNLLTLQKIENGEAFNQLAREIRKEEMQDAGTYESDPGAKSLKKAGYRRRAVLPPDSAAEPLLGARNAPEQPRRATLWPTPVKNEDRASKYTLETSRRHYETGSNQVHLSQVARDPGMYPTPTLQDSDKRRSKRPPPVVRFTASRLPEADRPSGSGAQLTLAQAAHIRDGTGIPQKGRLPTPMGSVNGGGQPNGLRGGTGSDHEPGMWQSAGHPEYGELNPEWVEWIMGWPLGWTSLKPIEPSRVEAWRELAAGRAGQANWWLEDPSDIEEMGVPKTVRPASKKEDLARISRIAALGNGQVSAAAAAAFMLLVDQPPPPEPEED